jgi:hypothetical protein
MEMCSVSAAVNREVVGGKVVLLRNQKLRRDI